MSSQSYPGLLLKLWTVPWSNGINREGIKRDAFEGRERAWEIWSTEEQVEVGEPWAVGTLLGSVALFWLEMFQRGWRCGASGRILSWHRTQLLPTSHWDREPVTFQSWAVRISEGIKIGESSEVLSLFYDLVRLLDSGVRQKDKIVIVMDFLASPEELRWS